MKKNIVLSVLHGYTYQFIEPFIQSYRRGHVEADLVIFTSDTVSALVKRLLKKRGAIIIEYSSKNPLDLVDHSLKENLPSRISINNYRFILFLDFLIKNKEKYENILLTDIRDVIFQSDPFKKMNNDSIYFFLEGEGEEGTFGVSLQNHIWSVEANGLEFTESILDKMVSCAGVTAGNINNIIHYLNYMRTSLTAWDELKWGIDQGIHNGYIYKNEGTNIILSGNEKSLVCTLGLCKDYRLNKMNEIITPSNDVYSVVHQYDRIRELNVLVRKKYIGLKGIQLLKKVLFSSRFLNRNKHI